MTEPILMNLPESLETERLMLRVPHAGDGGRLLVAVRESLPELRRFLASLPWVSEEPTLASCETYCRKAHADFLARRDLPFLLLDKTSGEVVGASGLHRMVWTTPKFEVGYWGRTAHRGRGFVSEAVRALAGWAFSDLGAVRVELITDALNAESRRVAERCHFVLEGVLRQDRRAPDGSLRDTCVYARTAAGWPVRTAP